MKEFKNQTQTILACAVVFALASGCLRIRSGGTSLYSESNTSSSSGTASTPTADHLVLVAGDAQNASAGSSVTTNPKVKVVDSSGNPISGVVLTFTVTGGGGNVGSATVTSDALGFAETSFTMGATAGANTLVVARQGTALPGVPSTITFTETSKLVNLEVPITMLGNGISSENGSTNTFSRTQTQLTTTDYDGTVTYSFEIVATNADASNRNVTIVDASGASKGSITVNSASSATRYRAVFTPNAGTDIYRVKLEGTTADNDLIVHTARMIVKQVGATKTRIYIPLLQSLRVSAAAGYSKNDTFCAAAYCTNDWAYNLTNPGQSADIIWTKTSSNWKTLSGATPWTFEVTMFDGNASVGNVSLVNSTAGTRVTATELSESNSTTEFAHKSVDFADNATNFTDGSAFMVRTLESGANFVAVDHAGLWVKLQNLEQGEVYYPVSTYAYYYGGIVTQQRVLFDGSLFSNPLAYFESNGFGDLSQEVELHDHGTNDNSSAGTSMIIGSDHSFVNTAEKIRFRSGALSLTNGNRYVMNSSGSGGANGSLVVGFSW